MFRFFFKQERCKDEKLQSKYACDDQPSAPGCRTDGAINRCMGSVSAISGPDTELQVPDEILQKIGMKTSFSKDVPKLSNVLIVHHVKKTTVFQLLYCICLYCLSLLFDVSFCLPFCWCPCMAINVSVQYDGGFLPDIILLTQCYYHRGTRLNAMKRFCIFSY